MTKPTPNKTLHRTKQGFDQFDVNQKLIARYLGTRAGWAIFDDDPFIDLKRDVEAEVSLLYSSRTINDIQMTGLSLRMTGLSGPFTITSILVNGSDELLMSPLVIDDTSYHTADVVSARILANSTFFVAYEPTEIFGLQLFVRPT